MSYGVTRSPIELSWTANNKKYIIILHLFSIFVDPLIIWGASEVGVGPRAPAFKVPKLAD